MPEHRYSIFIWQELIWPQTVWRPLWIKMRTRKLSFLIFSRSSTPLGPQPASFKHWKVHYFHFMAKDESEISHPFEKTLNDISENDYIIKYILIILLLFAHFGFFCSGTCFTKAYRERRSCSVLKPAKDWLRIIPLGPPGEWVPAAMISGMWGDTPGERKKNPQNIVTFKSSDFVCTSPELKVCDTGSDAQYERCGWAAFRACADMSPLKHIDISVTVRFCQVSHHIWQRPSPRNAAVVTVLLHWQQHSTDTIIKIMKVKTSRNVISFCQQLKASFLNQVLFLAAAALRSFNVLSLEMQHDSCGHLENKMKIKTEPFIYSWQIMI